MLRQLGFLNRASQVRIMPGAPYKRAGQRPSTESQALALSSAWGHSWCELLVAEDNEVVCDLRADVPWPEGTVLQQLED
jgi:hypothetical protein